MLYRHSFCEGFEDFKSPSFVNEDTVVKHGAQRGLVQDRRLVNSEGRI